jgi:hypothetical protein
MQIERCMFNLHKFTFMIRNYIHRQLESLLDSYLRIFPVVAVLGPRQCGKSTLVKNVFSRKSDMIYLDLQNYTDLNKLTDPHLYFELHRDKRFCLDEIQLVPELFSALRSEVDRDRRNGRFVLLGSASRDLVQKSSETLAGRIGYLELTPFLLGELTEVSLNTFWNRGGYPESVLAETDEFSQIWRENFIRTYLERDIPQLGFQIPALQFRRFLILCAHHHGQTVNLSRLAADLGMSHTTVRRYIDLLEQTFIVRTLQPFEANTKKRIVKAPKLYMRDTGLLHRLLGIDSMDALFSHPVFGASWEGLVLEQVAAASDGSLSYYRTSNGDEMDLVIEINGKRIAVECKASSAPRPTSGFYRACSDVGADEAYVVAPTIGEAYPLAANATAIGVSDFIKVLQRLG